MSFQNLKKELLDENKSNSQKTENSKDSLTKGKLTIYFKGKWFLIDAKTKIIADGKLIATESTKKGFSIDVPLESSSMDIKLTIAGIKSTEYNLTDIDVYKNHKLTVSYDDTWGRYSKNPEMKTDD